MFTNLSKIMFLLMLMLGSIISISANSWVGVWIGLEINLLAFIPLMTSKNNLNNSEAALTYFLIQAFASSVIMFSMVMYMIMMDFDFYLMNFNNKALLFDLMMILTLMLKLGAAPLHFWFPNVMENSSWTNGLILMTWQKLAPMMILSYLNLSKALFIIVMITTFMGAIGGLNQTSLRKLMAFSSINHIGWMILALMFNENLWLMYFMFYTFLNYVLICLFKIFQIFYLNQMYYLFMNSHIIKFSLLTSLLSLGGLPPFLGFLPKWLIIQSLLLIKLNFLTLFIILMSLTTLYYYLKISFAAFLLNYENLNLNYISSYKNSPHMIMLMLNFSSLFGFFLLINLIYTLN